MSRAKEARQGGIGLIMDRIDELSCAYLDGAISADETVELAELLDHEPERWSQLLENRRVGQLLDAHYRSNHDEAVQVIMQQIRGEADPFVDLVAREIAHLPQQQAGPNTGFGVRAWAWFTGAGRRFVACGATGAVLLALGLWLYFPTSGQPVVELFRGPAPLLERGAKALVCFPGLELRPFDHLRTSSNTEVVITFGTERTRLRISSGSDFRVGSPGGGKKFDLDAGEIEASVARQPLFKPMTISTPEARVRVLGTRFTLSTSSNATRLNVIAGMVRLTSRIDGTPVRVRSGQYTVAGTNRELRALPKTGTISREWWIGASGISVNGFLDDPRYPKRPSGRDLAKEFEFGPVRTNRLVVRFRGFINPPVKGDYQFWIAGATDAALFLSKTDQPTEKVLIAAAGNTKPRSWDESNPLRSGGSQVSQVVPLIAGRRYYIEAFVQIDKGVGHLSVAWKRPGAPRELLTGEFLSPAER
jgi:hypothetical protein